jgi:adenylosuccinate lyase
VPRKLTPAEIEAQFDLDYHFKEVDTIFARVFGEVHR